MSKKFWKKSNLDELQEQKLLHIEKKSFWLLYFLIFMEIMGKLLIDQTPETAFPELLCFLAVSLYMVGACLKNGIWDRHLKADAGTNARVSAVAAAAVLCFNAVMTWNMNEMTGNARLLAAALSAVFSGAVTFVLCFVLMQAASGLYRKRRDELEESEEDEDDD